MSALRAASVLLPARAEVAWHLAILLSRAGRCAEADSVYEARIAPLYPPGRERALKNLVFRCRPDAAGGRP